VPERRRSQGNDDDEDTYNTCDAEDGRIPRDPSSKRATPSSSRPTLIGPGDTITTEIPAQSKSTKWPMASFTEVTRYGLDSPRGPTRNRQHRGGARGHTTFRQLR
jgi:hypothetical protein